MLNIDPETKDALWSPNASQGLPDPSHGHASSPPQEVTLDEQTNPLPRPICRDGSDLSSDECDEVITTEDSAVATMESSESECDHTSSSSECEDENSVIAKLHEESIAQLPQVLVENSSDVRVGPHYQYNGPITVKQYITVGANGAPDSDNSAHVPQLKGIANISLTPDASSLEASLENKGINGIHKSDDPLFSKSEGTAIQRLKLFFNKRFNLVGLLMLILVIIVVALVVTLSGSADSSQDSQNITISCKKKDIRTFEGDKSAQWIVEIESRIGKLEVTWYNPQCEKIETTDPRYEVYPVDHGNGKMESVLNVLNIDKFDRGIYKLHVGNDMDERWDYFTLEVEGTGPTNKVVACYVAEWAHKRQGLGKFTVEDIDPAQCTILLFAFANLNTTTNSIYSADPAYDLEEDNIGAYKKMTSLKEKYPNLKVLISMGGWSERMDKNYSIVAESPERRKQFISSVVDFIRKYNFDGLDLHWQYPAEQSGRPPDKENFVYLLKELKEAFKRENEKWLLTAPLGVMPDTIERAYNIPEISKHLDYMFALCYAYHGFWDYQTGPNAPLYAVQVADRKNVYSSITALIRLGAPRNKLVLGLPLYGRNFILQDAKDGIGFGAPTEGQGFIGDYVQEQGTWGYNEICVKLGEKHSLWVVRWDNVTHTPYMVKEKLFMSYDNEKSLAEKVKFAKERNLAGVLTYSLDTDDFRGTCAFDKTGVTNYPLMRAINRALAFGPMEPCPRKHS